MEILQLFNGIPKTRLLARVTAALDDGELAIIPTDTNYAAVCSLNSKLGINRLYALKTGKSEKKITLFCADLTDISLYATVSNQAYRVMKSLIPGPYTFILPASRMVPKMVLTKRRTVGIRNPDHPACRQIPAKLQTALLALSVKEIAVKDDSISSLEDNFRGSVAFLLDGGSINSESSTILDLTGEQCVIVREGKGEI